MDRATAIINLIAAVVLLIVAVLPLFKKIYPLSTALAWLGGLKKSVMNSVTYVATSVMDSTITSAMNSTRFDVTPALKKI